jgi:hypothetical protein
MTRAGAQAVGHRVDVGVDAGADVLQVDHQRIESAQHLGGRFARLTVERVDRHPATRVVDVRRLDHVVLHVRPEPVLRSEDRAELHTRRCADAVQDVDKPAIDGRVVADDTDVRVAKTPRRQQTIGPETHHDLIIGLSSKA